MVTLPWVPTSIKYNTTSVTLRQRRNDATQESDDYVIFLMSPGNKIRVVVNTDKHPKEQKSN